MTLSTSQSSVVISHASLLRDVTARFESGEVVAIVGPNGAGKSSLLRILSGEWTASTGTVTLHGCPVHEWPRHALAQTLAILPQHAALNFAFTGEEVVALGRTPHASGADRDRDIVRAALRLVDAESLAARYYTAMSGGEKQRIQLARVLAQVWETSDHGERFLFLDEPSAAFDLAHQKRLISIIGGKAREGIGIGIVLHDLNLAASVADRILVMKNGQIEAAGQPDVSYVQCG